MLGFSEAMYTVNRIPAANGTIVDIHAGEARLQNLYRGGAKVAQDTIAKKYNFFHGTIIPG